MMILKHVEIRIDALHKKTKTKNWTIALASRDVIKNTKVRFEALRRKTGTKN